MQPSRRPMRDDDDVTIAHMENAQFFSHQQDDGKWYMRLLLPEMAGQRPMRAGPFDTELEALDKVRETLAVFHEMFGDDAQGVTLNGKPLGTKEMPDA